MITLFLNKSIKLNKTEKASEVLFSTFILTNPVFDTKSGPIKLILRDGILGLAWSSCLGLENSAVVLEKWDISNSYL